MSLATRLKRLECRQKTDAGLTMAEAMAKYSAMWAWLGERGYADPDEAVAAGETGPAGLGEMLQEQAKAYRRSKQFQAWEERGFADPKPPGI